MQNKLTRQDQQAFSVALYWANKPIKKFVVTLSDGTTKETRMFGTSNSDRAAELALANTDLNRETAVVKEIRLATPEDLGTTVQHKNTPATNNAEPEPDTLCRMPPRIAAMAAENGLKQFAVPGSGELYLLGNAPAIAAVQRLQQQHQQLAAALADCLAMMQLCDQHKLYQTDWSNPVGVLEWDITVAAAALVLKQLPKAN